MTNSHDCLLNACFRQFFSLSTDNCPIFILYREIYYTIGHVRYINILTWLRGFRVKIVKFFGFFCLSIPKRDSNTKKATPNIDVWPESLGAMLEYWYRTWPIQNNRKKMIGHRSCFRENVNLPPWRGSAAKKRSPFFNACALMTREIMRSRYVQCNTGEWPEGDQLPTLRGVMTLAVSSCIPKNEANFVMIT